MKPYYTEIPRQTILIDGHRYTGDDFAEGREPLAPTDANTGPDAAFRAELAGFLREWFGPDTAVTVRTSGSTGIPKEMRAEKARMMRSACLTCEFLHLQPGDSALLCMPLRYIAGKMVVVRALVGGLDLWPVAPSGHPLQDVPEAPVFAAMTPMQARDSLSIPAERERLRRVRQLLLGGGAVSPRLTAELRDFPHAVWSSYGMTETLSHIALRRLNGPEAADLYTPLPGTSVRTSREGTLLVRAPHVCPGELATNDLVEVLPDGHFRIKGRKDNVIDSGGIKIQIEEVEAALREWLTQPFLVTAAPDERLGETVVLLTEGEPPADWAARCEQALPPYHRPRRACGTARLPLTETGKPDRAAARRLAEAAR